MLLRSAHELPVQELRMPGRLRLREGEVTSSMCACDPIRKTTPSATGEAAPVAVGAPTCRLERVGIVWSSLCAIHCTVPLVVAGVALATGAHAHQHTHDGHATIQVPLVIASVLLAGVLLFRSYVLRHRNWRPLALLGVGAVVLALGHLISWTTAATAMAVTTTGFAAVLVSQLANIVLVRRTSTCCVKGTCCLTGTSAPVSPSR
jgi:hypothetical protein